MLDDSHPSGHVNDVTRSLAREGKDYKTKVEHSILEQSNKDNGDTG